MAIHPDTASMLQGRRTDKRGSVASASSPLHRDQPSRARRVCHTPPRRGETVAADEAALEPLAELPGYFPRQVAFSVEPFQCTRALHIQADAGATGLRPVALRAERDVPFRVQPDGRANSSELASRRGREVSTLVER